MNFLGQFPALGWSLLFLIFVFVPMEKVFPAKQKQNILRPNWILDFTFFVGQYLLWSGLVLWILSYFSSFLTEIIPQGFSDRVQSQPYWRQSIAVLIAGVIEFGPAFAVGFALLILVFVVVCGQNKLAVMLKVPQD